MMKQILKGHMDPATAYLVEDYPYGFTLRCRMRYWLESNNNGTRMVSQTSNPKKDNLFWNKPKASTYCRFAGCLYLDENGHVQWSGLHIYESATSVREWLAIYGEGLCEMDAKRSKVFLIAKELYEATMPRRTT